MKVDGSFCLDLVRFWSHNGYSIRVLLICRLKHKLINISQSAWYSCYPLRIEFTFKRKSITDIIWFFLSRLLRCCYSFLSIKRKLSDYLLIKMLFIDFQGNLKETCVQRSPGHFPKVTVIYRFNCIMCQIVLGF